MMKMHLNGKTYFKPQSIFPFLKVYYYMFNVCLLNSIIMNIFLSKLEILIHKIKLPTLMILQYKFVPFEL